MTLCFAARSSVDLRCKSEIERFITLTKPNIVINFAAYTDVDGSEKNQNLAMEINANAPSIISKCARQIGAILIHISSDYVLNSKINVYSDEKSEVKLCNFYGKSKALGEKLIQENCNKYLIFRTFLDIQRY